ncbi:hypothetical protein HCG49_17080 [Arenibacter sp. 6A1]|uniref:hypothetical protein n=1 Tax=Arenibacter sp. 6A1 TaxID=2720391 RepID=UPI001446B042|nr:hypothetical protein [Arenibacter sp. 6A1]NKI28270.1 hypothetical protein [Arenibacter sp. 6A1]
MAIKITIPQKWNDLQPRQIKKLAWLFGTEKSSKTIDLMIFFVLVDVRWWQFRKYRKVYKVLKAIGISGLKEHYAWVYEKTDLTIFVPIKKLKGRKMFPPADRMTNATIDEFAHADDLAIGFYNTKDLEYLQYLAAVLYRELGSDNKRLPFFKEDLEERAKWFKKLSPKTLLAIYLCYQGSRDNLVNMNPIVFPKTKNKTKREVSSSGLGKLILSFSGGKFGTYNETKNTNVYTFFSEFEEQFKNQKKQPKHA